VNIADFIRMETHAKAPLFRSGVAHRKCMNLSFEMRGRIAAFPSHLPLRNRFLHPPPRATPQSGSEAGIG